VETRPVEGCNCAAKKTVTARLNVTTDKHHSMRKDLRVEPASKYLQTELASQLLQAIDETLEMVGRSTRSEVFDWIEKRFMMRRDEIPTRLDDFSRCLHEIFGSSSKLIESNIVRSIYRRLGRKLELRRQFRLIDYILVLATDNGATRPAILVR